MKYESPTALEPESYPALVLSPFGLMLTAGRTHWAPVRTNVPEFGSVTNMKLTISRF